MKILRIDLDQDLIIVSLEGSLRSPAFKLKDIVDSEDLRNKVKVWLNEQEALNNAETLQNAKFEVLKREVTGNEI